MSVSPVAQSSPILCDPMNGSTPGLPVHHQLNGHEFEQTMGAGDVQGRMACCRPWGRKESHFTEQLD